MKITDLRTKPILVLGITGRQGSAVARRLLQRGWPVRGLVRNPDKPEAIELKNRGVEIVRGDFEDPASLHAAMERVYGVFSVQDSWERGVEAEIRQGTNIAEAAHNAGVSHFIYSSVGSANRDTGVPHFESKARIEERIKLLELPYTILRPVFFMENWESIAARTLGKGKILQPLSPDKPLQQIAVDDIGAFVASALEHPDDWIAHELDLAGDELTMPEVAEVFSRILGRSIEYVQIRMSEFRRMAGDDLALMYEWFNEEGYRANINYLKRQHPELKPLRQFLNEQEWVRQFAAPGPHTKGPQGSARR